MRAIRLRSMLCVWAVAMMVVGGCGAKAGGPKVPGQGKPFPGAAVPLPGGRPTIPFDLDHDGGALEVLIQEQRQKPAGAVVAPLPPAETTRLLSRLSPLPAIDNARAPAMRPPSPPPASSGVAHSIAFIVPTSKPVADAPVVPRKGTTAPSPLDAPDISPRGEIAAESEIRIRFDEPMIPVGAIGVAPTPPVTITPAIAGEWRWIDTRVAAFRASGSRFAQATSYRVTVAPGVKAISGSTLTTAATAQFSTPPVKIIDTLPRGVLRPDSPIALQLDQAIDPGAIASRLKITNTAKAGSSALEFRTMTLAEAQGLWAKNPSLKEQPLDASIGPNSVIVGPKTEWPAGMNGQIVLAAGAPSQEGPRVSTSPSYARFDVAEPFRVLGLTCDGTETPRMNGTVCPANGRLDVALSNYLDPVAFHSPKIRLDGVLREDDGLTLNVPSEVGRTFAITIEDGLVDRYGQPLVGERKLSFSTSRQRFDPSFVAPTGLLVLDPRMAIPQWEVEAAAIDSFRIQLYQVHPSDYFAFTEFERGERATPPGKRVLDKTYAVGRRSAADLRVDLRPALGQASTGHVIAVATGATSGPERLDPTSARRVAWVQITKLALSARIDAEHVNAWVHDMTPAKILDPVAGSTTSILVDGSRAPAATKATDATGHVTLDLLSPSPRRSPSPLVRVRAPDALIQTELHDDSTFTTIATRERAARSQNTLFYVTDDRFTYKPGEKVYVKGWVRETHDGVNPDIALPASGDSIAYVLTDRRGNKIAGGAAPLTAQGGFDLEVALPPNANLGTADFTFTARHGTHHHPIAIQEFRAPAFALTLDDDVTHAGARPLILGETIEMSTEAKYYAGGGLPGARIAWRANLRGASYQPPGWDAFRFDPPPRHDRDPDRVTDSGTAAVERVATLSGASEATILYGIKALPARGQPAVLNVDAEVIDADRAVIRASSRPILVHPSSLYVGLRQKPSAADTLEIVVTDIDGKPVAGVPTTVQIDGVLGNERDRDDAKIVDTQSCAVVSATTPVPCPFTPKDSKTAYSAIARVTDARGRANATHLRLWWWDQDERAEDLAIVPDRSQYRPGDVAKLDIRSKVLPATAVVTFARQGVISQRRIELTRASTPFEVPIEASYIKNVHVTVDRWAKKQRRTGASVPLTEATSASVNLAVDMEGARLAMTTRATKPLIQPGESATFEVEVRRDDKPVPGAEVALLVVDEAVLALSGKPYEDPLAPFYRTVAEGTTRASTLSHLDDAGDGARLTAQPGFERFSLDERGGYGTMGYGSGTGRSASYRNGAVSVRSGSVTRDIEARTDFRPNAVFAPRLATDANGKVQLTVKMPDSLTRFRVVALATADMRYFGKAESTIVTRRNLNARAVAPRFLTQGDTFALPVIVQNLDAVTRTIDVAARAANLTAVGPAGQRITIPAGQRAEVRFDFTTQARGRAIVQTVISSGDFTDAWSVELPVYEPATTESFATYGVVDEAAQLEQIAVPKDIFTDVGGAEVELASTQLQALTDAFWYLQRYPYECAEQRSARMLATAALDDVLDAFAAPGRPTKQELLATRFRDLRALTEQQNSDGGWGYFRDARSDGFVTMQVLSALAAEHAYGDVVKRATSFVSTQASALLHSLEKTAALPPEKRLDRAEHPYVVALAATALSSLASTGVDVLARAEKLDALAAKLDAYPIDAKARLLSLVAKQDRLKAMRQRLLTALLAATHETAAAATVTTSYVESERLLLVSSTRTTALVLDAILREAPEHALVTKLARGVLDGRKLGRWTSTQENLVALQTLRRYFDTYEKATPAFTGKLWFGAAAYAEQPFIGRSNARGAVQLDWQTLTPGSTQDVAITKAGPGRMYYRVGITYAPKRGVVPALDAGFVVRRSYTAVDDPGDVTRTATGYTIKLGAKVLVTLETINTTRRFNVAFVDPLPAGFETVNTELATAERAESGTGDRWDYQSLRDNRSEVFALDLREGTHRFTYTVRATTPGTFLAAPTKAEEMYSPETFGRSASEIVVIQ